MENTTPEERADFQTNSMTELLKLSKEQAEQVKEINLKYAFECGVYCGECSFMAIKKGLGFSSKPLFLLW